jgi:hypothetical protein
MYSGENKILEYSSRYPKTNGRWITSILKKSELFFVNTIQVYSLIAQKENALSKRIAETSLRVAEATQRENSEMKLISEEMKTLAISALRESSSMKFLQVITMLFLPATFVAVRDTLLFPT